MQDVFQEITNAIVNLPKLSNEANAYATARLIAAGHSTNQVCCNHPDYNEDVEWLYYSLVTEYQALAVCKALSQLTTCIKD